MKTVKVFGHKNPDTDAVCSAIAYAWFLNKFEKLEAKPYILGDINKETEYVLNKFGFEKPEVLTQVEPDDMVFIVDTNNKDQLIEGVEKTNILGIRDHHKLAGNIQTNFPIDIVAQPLGSTSTVILSTVPTEIESIDDSILGLMVAAIISDTLEFRSPTTTKQDREFVNKIAKRLNIDIKELASEMFKNKSDLSGKTARDLLLLDSKRFDLKGKKSRVSVLESTAPENAIKMKKYLLEDMEELKDKEDLDAIFFFIIDILNQKATAIISDEDTQKWVSEAFDVEFNDNTAVLEDVVSRKKQIIPNLSK